MPPCAAMECARRGRVLVAERLDVVALLGQGRRGRAAGQAGADHDDGELAAVGRVDQLGLEAAAVPALSIGPSGALVSAIGLAVGVRVPCQLTTPVRTANGTARKPAQTSTATGRARCALSARSPRGRCCAEGLSALTEPCRMCRPSASTATCRRAFTYQRSGEKSATTFSYGWPASPPGSACRWSGRGCGRRRTARDHAAPAHGAGRVAALHRLRWA